MTAEEVEAVVRYYFIEPGFKLGPGNVAICRFVDFEEDVLGQIFYFVVIPGVTINNTRYCPLVFLDQLFKCSSITRTGLLHQLVVWIERYLSLGSFAML